MTPSLRSLCAVWLLAACSSSSKDATPQDSGGAGEAGAPNAPSAQALHGTFTLAFKPAVEASMTAAFAVVSGTIYDGEVPDSFPLAVAEQLGSCQLLKPQLPFCSTGCGGDAVCVAEETCAPYPQAQDVGVVKLLGLGDAPVTLDPFPPSFAYQSQALPNPPCAEGARVQLEARGFSAVTPCIAPLVVTSSDLPVQREQPLTLTWEAPHDAELTTVHVKLDISHHGGKKGEIDCDVPDTGRFEVPARLITPLVELGLAGYPTIVLTRSASTFAGEATEVAFRVASSIEREVDTGVTSCTDDAGCPSPQRCNADKLACE